MTPPIPNDFRSIPALVEIINAGAKTPSFSTHALRHYIRTGETNGLAPSVRRIGRKILISESGFLSWLNGKTVPATGKRGRV